LQKFRFDCVELNSCESSYFHEEKMR